ncbi:MAG: helix-turn-helix transcriptional regulator [Cytophagales bacterium]|nr:helix-turn-helix transcriptional regulator [Cytophagales bacterium]
MEYELKNSIKVQRAIKNITQGDLAEELGVTRKTINAIENKKIIPSTLIALKMAKYFEVSVEEIFSIEEKL